MLLFSASHLQEACHIHLPSSPQGTLWLSENQLLVSQCSWRVMCKPWGSKHSGYQLLFLVFQVGSFRKAFYSYVLLKRSQHIGSPFHSNDLDNAFSFFLFPPVSLILVYWDYISDKVLSSKSFPRLCTPENPN